MFVLCDAVVVINTLCKIYCSVVIYSKQRNTALINEYIYAGNAGGNPLIIAGIVFIVILFIIAAVVGIICLTRRHRQYVLILVLAASVECQLSITTCADVS